MKQKPILNTIKINLHIETQSTDFVFRHFAVIYPYNQSKNNKNRPKTNPFVKKYLSRQTKTKDNKVR